MNHFAENEDLDFSDEILKFCFSWVMLYSSVDAAKRLLNSWKHAVGKNYSSGKVQLSWRVG